MCSLSTPLRWGWLVLVVTVILVALTFFNNKDLTANDERKKRVGNSEGVPEARVKNPIRVMSSVNSINRIRLPGTGGDLETDSQLRKILAAVASDLDSTSCVRMLQGILGTILSDGDRKDALAFLAEENLPRGLDRGGANWISDELLTVLRLQQPPWDGLAEALGEVAFQPDTNPVTRDYIMQHLGHLWEQYGAREEIEKTLWRATATAEELAPGSALIALSRGYARDGDDGKLAETRSRALSMARNPSGRLAVRVTALAIAGEGGGREVKKLAAELAADAATPVILRKVAENVLKQ